MLVDNQLTSTVHSSTIPAVGMTRYADVYTTNGQVRTGVKIKNNNLKKKKLNFKIKTNGD